MIYPRCKAYLCKGAAVISRSRTACKLWTSLSQIHPATKRHPSCEHDNWTHTLAPRITVVSQTKPEFFLSCLNSGTVKTLPIQWRNCTDKNHYAFRISVQEKSLDWLVLPQTTPTASREERLDLFKLTGLKSGLYLSLSYNLSVMASQRNDLCRVLLSYSMTGGREPFLAWRGWERTSAVRSRMTINTTGRDMKVLKQLRTNELKQKQTKLKLLFMYLFSQTETPPAHKEAVGFPQLGKRSP